MCWYFWFWKLIFRSVLVEKWIFEKCFLKYDYSLYKIRYWNGEKIDFILFWGNIDLEYILIVYENGKKSFCLLDFVLFYE